MKVSTKSPLRHSFALAAGLAALAVASNAQAQGITASAAFTDTPNGGSFNYVITLKNSAASTSPLGTFWYAWIPGGFFLPSSPSSVTAPTGWSDTIQAGSGKYSILFTDNSPTLNVIQPGGSLNFGFTTVDTPATLAAITAANGTTTVYSGNSAFSGNSFEFNVTQAVPEPSPLVLITVGSLSLFFAIRRKTSAA